MDHGPSLNGLGCAKDAELYRTAYTLNPAPDIALHPYLCTRHNLELFVARFRAWDETLKCKPFTLMQEMPVEHFVARIDAVRYTIN